jgi:hypothetical protein
LDALAGIAQTQVLVVIVAAAGFSCLVGWLLEGGFDVLRERWLSLRGSHASFIAARPVEERQFGDEFVRAFAVASKSYLDHASDEQAVIEAIVNQLGWSPTRARWFLAINREQVEQAAHQMRADEPT